jgi:hypothetical protein
MHFVWLSKSKVKIFILRKVQAKALKRKVGTKFKGISVLQLPQRRKEGKLHCVQLQTKSSIVLLKLIRQFGKNLMLILILFQKILVISMVSF